MKLGLSLGEASKPFSFVEKSTKNKEGLEFCMGLGFELETSKKGDRSGSPQGISSSSRCWRTKPAAAQILAEENHGCMAADHPTLQLDLLPFLGNSDGSSSGGAATTTSARGFDVNRVPSADQIDDSLAVDSPNSIASSLQMEISIFAGDKKDEAERAFSRGSDEEDIALNRKKLRLSKEQSTYLEESFKEHNTLNPKQKLALAKQLNLRPRQVEVWFQNRRARTKLKQTEVDCEYLKRCCETLTEDNRRLQKELQELRALKTSHPFYTQIPATTLTMCPSCERVATPTTTGGGGGPAGVVLEPRLYPISHRQPHESTA